MPSRQSERSGRGLRSRGVPSRRGQARDPADSPPTPPMRVASMPLIGDPRFMQRGQRMVEPLLPRTAHQRPGDTAATEFSL